MDLHHFDEETEALAQRIAEYSVNRVKVDPPLLDGTISPEILLPKLEGVITKDGLGPQKSL